MRPDVSKYEHLNVFQDSKQHWRIQYRPPKALQLQGAKKFMLRGQPNTPDFDAAYERAHAYRNNKPKTQDPLKLKGGPGSIDWLIDWFYQSDAFTKELSEATQYRRKIDIERFRQGDKDLNLLPAGHLPAATLPADKLKAVVVRIENAHMRKQFLAALRGLMKFAIDKGVRSDDPTVGIKVRVPKSEGFHTWTNEEIDQYRAFHRNGLLSRLVFELALELAARRRDVCLLGPQHVRNGRIEYRQQKTGARVSIEISPELQAAIAAYPLQNGQLTFTATSFGRARSYKGLSNTFAEWRAEAGLPQECVLHGLRKAHCRILAEAGCSVHEIAAHSGHKTLAEVERYTRAAEQVLLADRASIKMREAMAQRSARVVAFPKKRSRPLGH